MTGGSAWKLVFSEAAQKDVAALDASVRPQVLKVLARVALNPLPLSRGGYGKPLGGELSGLFKIKLLKAGVRVVYALREVNGEMLVVVVGMRRENRVYTLAAKRRGRLGV